MGHGANILSLYTELLFHLTAVMYVDDTNLLHWLGTSSINSDKLIAAKQRATTDYRRRAISSGGILKQNKCSVYISINTINDLKVSVSLSLSLLACTINIVGR